MTPETSADPKFVTPVERISYAARAASIFWEDAPCLWSGPTHVVFEDDNITDVHIDSAIKEIEGGVWAYAWSRLVGGQCTMRMSDGWTGRDNYRLEELVVGSPMPDHYKETALFWLGQLKALPEWKRNVQMVLADPDNPHAPELYYEPLRKLWSDDAKEEDYADHLTYFEEVW